MRGLNETMARQYWRPSNMLYPLPAVMISCADEEGRSNIMTAAWAGTICSDPVMVSVSIRPERYSHDVIARTGEFVINLTTEDLTFAADFCGVRSGRDVDKFGYLHLTKVPSRKVKAPSIGESVSSALSQVLKSWGRMISLLPGSCRFPWMNSTWMKRDVSCSRTPVWWPMCTVPISLWDRNWEASVFPSERRTGENTKKL